ncbi:MAG: S-layer homology domain-containing protein, partial [Spirulinaceae cyanobacterium]
AAISAITGDRAIATEELLLGAGLGALVELIPTFLGLNKVDLLVVNPNTDLNLTLTNDLVVSAQ